MCADRRVRWIGWAEVSSGAGRVKKRRLLAGHDRWGGPSHKTTTGRPNVDRTVGAPVAVSATALLAWSSSSSECFSVEGRGDEVRIRWGDGGDARGKSENTLKIWAAEQRTQERIRSKCFR
jgi:hypothetical protein